MIYHFDVVGLAFLGQDMSKYNVCAQIHMLLAPCHVYAQIYISMCSLSCLCIDQHVYVFFAMFLLRSTCLCLDLCIYVLRAMFVCLDLYVSCSAMFFYSPFVPSYLNFLCFDPFWCGVDLDHVVQAYICTPWPISKGLDHFLYPCLCLLFMIYAYVCLS